MYGRLTQFESREILESAFVVAAEFICKTFTGKEEYAFVGDESEKKSIVCWKRAFRRETLECGCSAVKRCKLW